jgi:hypothetical protein
MKTASMAGMVVRITGSIQLLLGIIIWLDLAPVLVPVHILIGLVLSIALLTLSYLAYRAGISTGMVIFTVVWALILPVLGMAQANLIPGPGHWIIAVVHLLFGIGAIGMAETLGARMQKQTSAT